MLNVMIKWCCQDSNPPIPTLGGAYLPSTTLPSPCPECSVPHFPRKEAEGLMSCTPNPAPGEGRSAESHTQTGAGIRTWPEET